MSVDVVPQNSQEGESQPKIQYTEDLREALALAAKLARQKDLRKIPDRDLLQALVMINRAFSELDGLLKHAGVPPKVLKQRLQATLAVSSELPQGESHVLVRAEALALATESGTRKIVDFPEILKALCASDDPVVRHVFESFQLTPVVIDEALTKTRAGAGPRMLLFFGRELGEVVVFVLFFLIVIKSLFGELRLIPSESMVPTLLVDDRIVIERVTRWYRPYERGDVLVFYPPMTQLKNDPWSLFLRLTGFSGLLFKKEDNIDVAYIKRLIGLPGDIIEVRPGIGVLVNGKLLDEPYTNELAYSCTLEPRAVVTLPEEPKARYLFLGEPSTFPGMGIWRFEQEPGLLDNATSVSPERAEAVLETGRALEGTHQCLSITVPEGHYFLMGDNRNESMDSRYWGFEPQSRVIGRAVYRIWPLSRVAPIDSPLEK